MTKYIFKALACAFIFASLAACSSDIAGNNDANELNTEATSLKNGFIFNVELADYNSTPTTRNGVNVVPAVQTTKVRLSNGLVAKLTLTPDSSAQSAAAATRYVPDDTYTMEAFGGSSHKFKGSISGRIVNNQFIPDNGKEDIILPHGNYHFLLYNSKVVKQDSIHKIAIENADGALFAFATPDLKITPNRQKLIFHLKRKGVRVKMKLSGAAAYSGATAKLRNANNVGLPDSIKHILTGDKWSTASKKPYSKDLTFGNVSRDAKTNKYVSYATEYAYFLYTTNAQDLMIVFTGGTYNGQSMIGAALPFNNLVFDVNGSYILNVELE